MQKSTNYVEIKRKESKYIPHLYPSFHGAVNSVANSLFFPEIIWSKSNVLPADINVVKKQDVTKLIFVK